MISRSRVLLSHSDPAITLNSGASSLLSIFTARPEARARVRDFFSSFFSRLAGSRFQPVPRSLRAIPVNALLHKTLS